MSSETVRIRPQAHRQLKQLAKRFGQPMTDVLERAIETLRRQVVLEQTNQAFAKLRKDKRAWAAEREERKAWDATLADHVED